MAPLLALFFGFFSTGLLAAEKAEFRGARHHEVPAWFKKSFLVFSDDVAEAAKNGKRLMVYFGQEGCPYCAELMNNNFSQAHIVDYTRKHFDSIDINMWGSREVTGLNGKVLPEREFSASLKVWFTPTLLFFDEKGNQVLRINGYYPPHQFLAALHYVAEKQEKNMTFREYLAKKSSPPSKGSLQKQAFFSTPPFDLSKMAGKKALAVFFEQKDCSACDRMHEVIRKDGMTLDILKQYHAIQLDRWSDTPVVTPTGEKTTARAWADSLNIAYVPTAVLYDGTKEIVRIEAMFKTFHVQSVLDYVVSGGYKTQPSLQRYLQARADHLREQGIAVDIWN